MSRVFWYMPARFLEDFKNNARATAFLRWLGYIPIIFIIYCCFRKKDLIKLYKTTIIYAAFGQFVLTLPISCYYLFLAYFTGRDLQSTVLMCTVINNIATILEFSGHLVIPVVAIGRFLGVVFGIRLNVYILTLLLIVTTSPHYYAAMYIPLTDGVPIPRPSCSPLLFARSFEIREPYTIFMYFPPIIAVFFNLGTLAYVFWHKSKRGPEVRPDRARDEMFVALGLLVQSIVPAVTIGSRGYVLWVEIFLIKVPAIISTITEYTALLTVGLNTLASIVFIRAFRMEFVKLFCRRFKSYYNKETTITISVQPPKED